MADKSPFNDASVIRRTTLKAGAALCTLPLATPAEVDASISPATIGADDHAAHEPAEADTEVSEDDYDAVLDLNLRSAFFVAQACARRMIAERSAGSLVHIGSQMAHVGGPDRSLYCASEWALEGMGKAFALDLAVHGIRGNTVAPTFIETSMTRSFLEDAEFRASVLARIKLDSLGRVEDVMGAAVFLASDASSLVTGTRPVVDGGWTAE